MRQKVLFFVNSYSGGAEKMTLNIASFLNPDCYEVIFYIVGKDWGLIKNFIPDNREVKLIVVRSYKDFLISKIVNAIREEKPAYVFSSLMPINWRLCFAVSLFPKVKAIIRINNYLYTQSFIQKARLFLAYRFAKSLIMQTSEMADEHIRILKLNPQKVTTLANPINTDDILKKVKNSHSPFPSSSVNYLFVGRIDPVKGLDVLLKSFAQVLTFQENALLHIVGETKGQFSNYTDTLLKIVSELGIEKFITFHGFSSNPYIFMKYADCFVLPSRNEGLPNVVIESLYLGTPVAVTCSVPVINRIVNHGINGHVVDVDDVKGLGAAMINSSKLGRIKSGYKSATVEDFQRLFKFDSSLLTCR